jgi:hypothetical protein
VNNACKKVQPMTFKEFLSSLFAPSPDAQRAPRPKPTPKAPSKISKSQFEAMVVARAQLFAMGQPVGTHHYLMARNAVQQELKRDNVSVQGSFGRQRSRVRAMRPAFQRQSKGIDEAAAEAGGAGKI